MTTQQVKLSGSRLFVPDSANWCCCRRVQFSRARTSCVVK